MAMQRHPAARRPISAPRPVPRAWLLLVLAVALCARMLVPTGWMPLVGPQGIVLAPCDGTEPMTPMSTAMSAAMPMKHAGTGMPMHHGGGDHQCPFAAAAAAITLAALAAPLLPAAVRYRPLPLPRMTAIGQGLAAPPPPPTGPPAFA